MLECQKAIYFDLDCFCNVISWLQHGESFVSQRLRNAATLRQGCMSQALHRSGDEQPVPATLGAAQSSFTPDKGQGYGTWLLGTQATPSKGLSCKTARHISQEYGVTQGIAHPKSLIAGMEEAQEETLSCPPCAKQHHPYPSDTEGAFGPSPLHRKRRFSARDSHCSSFLFLSPWVSSALCLQDGFGSLKPGNFL